MEYEERAARPLPPPPPYPPAPPLFPFIKRHKRLFVAAAAVLALLVIYAGYDFVMDHVGYRGSGTVDDIAGLPYGFGELFDGLESKGEVHCAYKTGSRSASCLFTGSADAEQVKAFCSDANGWESDMLADEWWRDKVEWLDAEPSLFLGPSSDNDFAARKETRYGMPLKIRYRHADKRFIASADQEWRGLRRKRWAD